MVTHKTQLSLLAQELEFSTRLKSVVSVSGFLTRAAFELPIKRVVQFWQASMGGSIISSV